MPRYHFNIREEDEYFPDQEGYDLPDIACARRAALKTLRETIRDNRSMPSERAAFEITDQHGRLLTVVAFRDALSLPDSTL
mgnify:CR=1 FL=1